MERHVQELLAKGLIQALDSPWPGPVVLVGKKDGSKWFCLDYQRIRPKKNCYIGVTRPTLKLGPTLHFFFLKPKKNLILAPKILILGFDTWLVA